MRKRRRKIKETIKLQENIDNTKEDIEIENASLKPKEVDKEKGNNRDDPSNLQVGLSLMRHWHHGFRGTEQSWRAL